MGTSLVSRLLQLLLWALREACSEGAFDLRHGKSDRHPKHSDILVPAVSGRRQHFHVSST